MVNTDKTLRYGEKKVEAQEGTRDFLHRPLRIPGLRYDPTVSLGNILVIAGMIVAIIFMWSDYGNRLMNAEVQIHNNSVAIQANKETNEKLVKVLEKLDANLAAAPLHIHGENGEVYCIGKPCPTSFKTNGQRGNRQ